MNGLFRREAVQAQQQQWLGRVQVARPPALRWLVLAAALTVLAVAAFLWFAPYTRKAELPGALVSSGQGLRAELYAPGRVIVAVHPGQPVRLRLEAYPYTRFGPLQGRVTGLSRVPLAAAEQAALALPAQASPTTGEPLFRIDVALAPAAADPLPLAAGMRLQADVRLERRRLIDWLFGPRQGGQEGS